MNFRLNVSLALLSLCGSFALCGPVNAQSSSTSYWGTATGGAGQVEQNTASSQMHQLNGLSAAAVNAASLGLLVNTGGSIVLNTI
jgi:pyridoxine 5'-phosphate synthase PdxJ